MEEEEEGWNLLVEREDAEVEDVGGKAAEECRLLAGGVDEDVSGWLINRPASTP